MQDEKLEFDSEELDLHKFNWEDIRMVRSTRALKVRFDTKATDMGSLLVTTNAACVVSEIATNTYPRSEVLAITRTGFQELDKWSGKLSAGLYVRAGNTKELEYNAHLTVHRRTPSTQLLLNYQRRALSSGLAGEKNFSYRSWIEVLKKSRNVGVREI